MERKQKENLKNLRKYWRTTNNTEYTNTTKIWLIRNSTNTRKGIKIKENNCDLRHSCIITNNKSRRRLSVVKERLGQSITTTIDTYSHLYPSNRKHWLINLMIYFKWKIGNSTLNKEKKTRSETFVFDIYWRPGSPCPCGHWFWVQLHLPRRQIVTGVAGFEPTHEESVLCLPLGHTPII